VVLVAGDLRRKSNAYLPVIQRRMTARFILIERNFSSNPDFAQ